MRRLSPTGDFTYGQNGQDFITDNEAVRQLIQTRMQLYRGAFWRDINAGFPLSDILGGSASPERLSAIDNAIRAVILGTEGVLGIVSYSSTFDPTTRAYSYTSVVQTIYSTTEISGVL
jgi:hypothetical protein